MARKKSPHLTDAELRLMDVLWEKGSATVSDVAEALPNIPALAYSTVLTTLRIDSLIPIYHDADAAVAAVSA